MSPLPTDRTTANTPAEHVSDHNTAHGILNALNGTYVGLIDAATGTAATDTAVVQAALTAVPSTGGTVQGIAPGAVYLINAPLFIKSGTILKNVTLKRADTVITGTIVNAANTGSTTLLYAGGSALTPYTLAARGSYIELDNVTLDGNKAGQTALTGIAGVTSNNLAAHNFSATYVDRVIVKNCTVKNSVMNGVYVFGCTDADVSDNRFIDSADSRLRAFSISKNAVSLSGNETDGAKVLRATGNYITGTEDEGIQYGYAQDVIVADNHIYDSLRKGIEGDSAFVGGATPPGNIVISGNFVRDSGEEGIGIANSDNQKITIADNQIYDSAWSGINVGQDSESTFIVSGNIIEGVAGGYAGTPTTSYHGLLLAGHKLTVTDNEIRDCAGSGISLQAGRLLNVSGNTVEECCQVGIQFPASSTDTVKAMRIGGNVIGICDQGGIRVTNTGMAIELLAISDNVISEIGKLGAGASPNGIGIDGSGNTIKRLSITGNVVVDERLPSPEMGFALNMSVVNSSTSTDITGNVLFPGKFRGIEGRNKNVLLLTAANAVNANGGVFRNVSHSAAPVSGDGTFLVGDIAFDNAPAVTTTNGVSYVRIGWECTVAGTPGTWVELRALTGDLALTNGAIAATAGIDGYKIIESETLTAGEGTINRLAPTNSATAMTSGLMRIAYFTAKRTETIANVRIFTGNTAAAATPTLVRVGIWTADAAGALLSLVASTTNDTALLATPSTFTAFTKALTASFSKVAGTRYAVGLLVVSGAAVPTIPTTAGALAATETSISPKVCGTMSGLADLPSSAVSGSVGNSGNVPYFALVT